MHLIKNKTVFFNINVFRGKITPEKIMLIQCLKNLRALKTLRLILVILFGLALHGGFSAADAGETVSLPPQAVAPGDATLTVNLELPAGYKFNPEAPSTVGIKSGDKKIVPLDEKYAQNLPVAKLPLCLKVPVKEGQTTLQATFRLNFCDEKLGVCFIKEAVLNLPVEVSKTATDKKLEMVYKVKAN